MSIFEAIAQHEHEQVVFCQDKESGLKAIIAIHSTELGPSLGGVRMWHYQKEEDALRDVLRLARGMTYKASVAGLNLGGGKAVIIGNPCAEKSEVLFRSFGRFVEGLAGRYITAEDVGITVKDIEHVRLETKYVCGISESLGGSGDPSPVTAYGVYVGIKACAHEVWGNDSLQGKRIVVQGLGKVGLHLAEHLSNEEAELFITDINPEKVTAALKTVKATAIKPEEVFTLKADIFSPNALGAVICDESINKLQCAIIAGGANNQLESEQIHGELLKQKGILYAPDYVINAGGLINVANELEGYSRDRALKQADGIYEVLKKIIKTSKEADIPTHEASNKLAEERIRSISRLSRYYTGHSGYAGKFSFLYNK
ncbi:MAG: Glu/Leu/Phe/Val dehydrogenase [Ignavibacteriales bacterium]|nr:Glu/Leu/Phe/Val dehydrogenase [Ignavibacteriales bacterium]